MFFIYRINCSLPWGFEEMKWCGLKILAQRVVRCFFMWKLDLSTGHLTVHIHSPEHSGTLLASFSCVPPIFFNFCSVTLLPKLEQFDSWIGYTFCALERDFRLYRYCWLTNCLKCFNSFLTFDSRFLNSVTYLRFSIHWSFLWDIYTFQCTHYCDIYYWVGTSVWFAKDGFDCLTLYCSCDTFDSHIPPRFFRFTRFIDLFCEIPLHFSVQYLGYSIDVLLIPCGDAVPVLLVNTRTISLIAVQIPSTVGRWAVRSIDGGF